MATRIFLHGLDSSGRGTKGIFFSNLYPDMLRPDFTGTLQERIERLNNIISGYSDLIVVGSSFGGLMGAQLAIEQPGRVKRLVLLAPALNFHEYRIPEQMVDTETLVVIGKYDDVTPPDIVLPAAKATFSNLQIRVVDDDHLLHKTYRDLNWDSLLV